MAGVDGEGYRLISRPGHPMARKSGVALEHRVVLFDHLGPGPHPCHWCGKKLQWQSSRASGICVDHLDDDRLNNILANLVPACVGCNSRRGIRRVVASAIVPSFMEAVAARVVAAGPAVDVVEAAVTATMAELSVALKERRFGRATLNSLDRQRLGPPGRDSSPAPPPEGNTMDEMKPEPAAGQVWEGPTGQRFEIRKFGHGRAYGVRDGVNYSVQRGNLLDSYTLVAEEN